MLDAETIRASLSNGWAAAQIRCLGSVTSTNDIAWAWALAGCPEGTTVFAEEQLQGRGRFGRTWHSPRGRGLLMSVVLRPTGDTVSPAHLTALAALAAVEAIEAETGLRASIRWPNDVAFGPSKVAGVLVERRGGSPGPCVVGIGINVNTRPEEFPADIRTTATSLFAETQREVPRERLAALVLHRLHSGYVEAACGHWPQAAARWRQRAALLDEVITVQAGPTQYRGRLIGADPLTGVELELAGGHTQCFRAEDTTLVLGPD